MEKDDNVVKVMPLINNTVTRRIDEMGEYIETQLVEKLKSRNLSLQMDESTLRDKTTTSAADIYGKLTNYLHVNNISMQNIISFTADGTPVMMSKKKGCFKLMKDENSEMILVHCVIHRENSEAKNITLPLNEVLTSVVKCINSINANTKCERLFKQFCENENGDYVRLLLHIDVRGLSKGNCLKRFKVLYDILSVFLSDKSEMNPLLTLDGSNRTLVDAQTMIFGFVTFIEIEFPTWVIQPMLVKISDVSMQYQE
ncbi:unnamed protein product [Lepeophtheirus salmonis]|uniref:(salmon louse) hypothetical protein n=1 Tax=Lepeophtheirus salmonis TaxID=72036 RepID=A0A7R8CMA5_LEPSM|nr:unnamed protein product [Lepeophtheirus salmonis]CAF2862080.1 unnamed protein product [Lepeophtheirus salmonis]